MFTEGNSVAGATVVEGTATTSAQLCLALKAHSAMHPKVAQPQLAPVQGVSDSGFRVSRLRGRVSGFEFWGSGFRISGLGFRSYGFGVRATSKESTRARVEERTSSQDASNGQPWCPSTCSVHN